MTAVSGWADLMRQSVTIEPATGKNIFGEKTYGAATAYRCRLVGKRRQVINASGESVISGQTVYLMSADAVDPESRVTLSTDDAGSTEESAIHPVILETGRFPDERGQHHSVLFLLLLISVLLR